MSYLNFKVGGNCVDNAEVGRKCEGRGKNHHWGGGGLIKIVRNDYWGVDRGHRNGGWISPYSAASLLKLYLVREKVVT